ncbi:MAG: MFS transporter, partial [archaeon]|nr:MFS transporter [archaeon]
TSIIYMMVLAGTLVAFARIAADREVRKIMAGGLLLFTIGSLMCGLSPSFGVLILSRAVQAVGAGMMAATGPMCCTEHLPPEKLGFGLSIVTIGASVGFAVGPALGGVIVEFVSWHWIFLINIPLGAVAIPLMLKAIPPGSGKGIM